MGLSQDGFGGRLLPGSRAPTYDLIQAAI